MTTDTLHRTPRTTPPPTCSRPSGRFAHEVSARADEAERAGTMPVDLVDRFRRAGLFRALQPRALGGFELEPQAFVELIEELSRADGSAGWTATIGAGGSAFAAWLEPAVARQTFGPDADFTSATVFAPTGRLVPVDPRGYSVSGRWPFASGCRHAEWFVMGGFVFDGDAPRMVPDRGPDWRLAWFPGAAGEVVDALGRDGVARHGQQRRRRRLGTGARGADHQSVLRAGAPRRPAVALALLHAGRHRVGRCATRHRSPRARRAGRARTHQGPGRHFGADRPRRRRARRHGPGRGTAAGGSGVRVSTRSARCG